MRLALPGPLVTTMWLADALTADGLCILDATKYLPTEALDGRAEFACGHIPGGRFFDIDLFADPEADLPHMAPTPGRFARLAALEGIGDKATIIIYDQKGQFSAARAWWLFRLFGHQRVALLDGGLPGWRAAGLALEHGAPAAATARHFTPRLCAALIAGLGDVEASLLPNTATPCLVLDARPAARFAGVAPEPRPGCAPGHIPGAVSMPATTLLDAHGRFLPPAELRALFQAAGVIPGRRVVTSCGTGVTAATLAFALHLAQLSEAAVYDGSWAEWGSLPDTPKQLGVQVSQWLPTSPLHDS